MTFKQRKKFYNLARIKNKIANVKIVWLRISFWGVSVLNTEWIEYPPDFVSGIVATSHYQSRTRQKSGVYGCQRA